MQHHGTPFMPYHSPKGVRFTGVSATPFFASASAASTAFDLAPPPVASSFRRFVRRDANVGGSFP